MRGLIAERVLVRDFNRVLKPGIIPGEETTKVADRSLLPEQFLGSAETDRLQQMQIPDHGHPRRIGGLYSTFRPRSVRMSRGQDY